MPMKEDEKWPTFFLRTVLFSVIWFVTKSILDDNHIVLSMGIDVNTDYHGVRIQTLTEIAGAFVYFISYMPSPPLAPCQKRIGFLTSSDNTLRQYRITVSDDTFAHVLTNQEK